MLSNQSDNQLLVDVAEQTENKSLPNVPEVSTENSGFAITNLNVTLGGLLEGSFLFAENVDKFSEVTIVIDEKPIISIKLESIQSQALHDFDFSSAY